MPREALAAGLLAAALLSGCIFFGPPQNQLWVTSNVDGPAWADVRITERGTNRTLLEENFTLAPHERIPRELPSGYGEWTVRANASTGSLAPEAFRPGCGSTCYLTIHVSRDGVGMSTLHGD